jgi:hypothetical protein
MTVSTYPDLIKFAALISAHRMAKATKKILARIH